MSDRTPLESGLSRRAMEAVAAWASAPTALREPIVSAWDAAPDAGLMGALRDHLLAGETHYPARPGMTELRERVDSLLPELGVASRGADSVLITAGEGEALFVTLLGLGVVPDGVVTASGAERHAALLAWTGVTVVPADPGRPAMDPPEQGTPTVRVIGDVLFRDRPVGDPAPDGAEGGGQPLSPDDLLVGSFDALRAMYPFRLGFVAGDPDWIKRITKWKQASSICSPGPSQRAALWALGVRR